MKTIGGETKSMKRLNLIPNHNRLTSRIGIEPLTFVLLNESAKYIPNQIS